MSTITSCRVRMYRMGTGDCFILKFFSGETESFKMMIDCGTWQGTREELRPYLKDLMEYVGGAVDVLVVTHEHKDHVYGFEAGEDLLANLRIGQTWMAWTEDPASPLATQWLKDYGDKKKALMIAGNRLREAAEKAVKNAGDDPAYEADKNAEAKMAFAGAVGGLADLEFSADGGTYAGPLKGMKIAKERIAGERIRYCLPGEIIPNLPGAPGIRMYVLGPPRSWTAIRKESGKTGDSYEHNNQLAQADAFAAAVLAMDEGNSSSSVLPFDARYVVDVSSKEGRKLDNTYRKDAWRQIETDWLNTAGSMALRVNSMTNNLSLALAIEFEDSGRVMLFPGDAEFGSWESWQDIPWTQPSADPQKNLTEELLNRTVFYKVAHHLSHNGTARRLGLEMMTHPELVAMATLDYAVISNTWKGTMPNQGLLRDLLARTKGRLLVMKEDELPFDRKAHTLLSNEIRTARTRMSASESASFDSARAEQPLYLQFDVDGRKRP